MTSTLLNIAGKINPQTVALFETVSRAIADMDMPYSVRQESTVTNCLHGRF
ncbi:MAG: hypothetical protein BMS9Abin36_0117 [Gammaproteobacteria bacterium]|nr:MAG: hypothetical protein BMS9Abin36_0117 [Gammaproteobacteria bacterium]